MLFGKCFKARGISAATKGSEFITIAIKGEDSRESADAVFGQQTARLASLELPRFMGGAS